MDTAYDKRSLDVKTITLMEEQLNQEAIIYKKYLNALDNTYDNEIKEIFYEASEKHKRNYLNILSYLDL